MMMQCNIISFSITSCRRFWRSMPPIAGADGQVLRDGVGIHAGNAAFFARQLASVMLSAMLLASDNMPPASLLMALASGFPSSMIDGSAATALPAANSPTCE
jgi:hypothetical protein